MSSVWMKALGRSSVYADKRRGDLVNTSPQACRAVLNRLAQRANDVGVVAIYTADLERHTGYSHRAVQYAIAQLIRDGWIWRGVRGQGSRAADFRGKPAPTVYALRPLPQGDLDGPLAPSEDYLRQVWHRYAFTPSFRSRPRHQRLAIKDACGYAWGDTLPVDNLPESPRPTRKEGVTYAQRVAPSITSRTSNTPARRTGHLRPVDPWAEGVSDA